MNPWTDHQSNMMKKIFHYKKPFILPMMGIFFQMHQIERVKIRGSYNHTVKHPTIINRS